MYITTPRSLRFVLGFSLAYVGLFLLCCRFIPADADFPIIPAVCRVIKYEINTVIPAVTKKVTLDMIPMYFASHPFTPQEETTTTGNDDEFVGITFGGGTASGLSQNCP
jgi:hypothetical protein